MAKRTNSEQKLNATKAPQQAADLTAVVPTSAKAALRLKKGVEDERVASAEESSSSDGEAPVQVAQAESAGVSGKETSAVLVESGSGSATSAGASAATSGAAPVPGFSLGQVAVGLAGLGLVGAAAGGGSSSSVQINQSKPVNNAPVGVADTLSATEDTAVTYTAAQLLGNDTDVDGDTLAIKSVGNAVGGTVVLNGNGTVTFTPAANFNGAASFSYVATDGKADTAVTSVTVNVAAVNDAPSGADKTITFDGLSYTLQAADFGFSDVRDNPADQLLGVKITTLPTAGTLTYGGVPVTAGQLVLAADEGELVYSPPSDDSGISSASFTFQVLDSGGENGGTNIDPTPNTITFRAPDAVTTFGVSEDQSGVITFTGDATGPIDIRFENGFAIFSRDGVVATTSVSDFSSKVVSGSADLEIDISGAADGNANVLIVNAPDATSFTVTGDAGAGVDEVGIRVDDKVSGYDSRTVTVNTSSLVNAEILSFIFESTAGNTDSEFDNDAILLSADSVITGISTIKVRTGTVDFSDVSLPEGIGYDVQSALVLNYTQFTTASSFLSINDTGGLLLSLKASELPGLVQFLSSAPSSFTLIGMTTAIRLDGKVYGSIADVPVESPLFTQLESVFAGLTEVSYPGIVNLTEAVRALQAEFDAGAENFGEAVAQLTNSVGVLAERVGDNAETQFALQSSISDLSAMVSRETSRLEAAIAAGDLLLSNQIDQVAANLNTLDGVVKTLQATVAGNATAAANALAAAQATLEGALDALTAEVTKEVARLDHLIEAGDLLLSGEIDSIAASLSTLDGVVKTLQATVAGNATAAANALAAAQTALQGAIDALKLALSVPAPSIDAVAGDDVVDASETSFSISGKGIAGYTVTLVFTSGAALVGGNTAVVNQDGNWNISVNAADVAAFGQGGETVTVTQSLNGVPGLAASAQFVVDTVANGVPTLAIVSANEQGVTVLASDVDGGPLTLVNAVNGVVSLQNGSNTVLLVRSQPSVVVTDLVASDGEAESAERYVLIQGTGGGDVLLGNGVNGIYWGANGDDQIRGGAGRDLAFGGAGNDKFVLVGVISQGEYTDAAALGNLLTNAGINRLIGAGQLLAGNGVSEAEAGEVVDGGDGTDTLYVFGTIDLSQVTIAASVENLGVFSTVSLTVEQLGNLTSIELLGNTRHTITLVGADGIPLNPAAQQEAFEQWLDQVGQQLFFTGTGPLTSLTIGGLELGSLQEISDWLYNGGYQPFADELAAEVKAGDLPHPTSVQPQIDAIPAGSVADDPASAALGAVANLSGTITFRDGVFDLEPLLTLSAQGQGALKPAGEFNQAVAGQYGTLYFNDATGAYQYVPDAAAVNALDAGSTPTEEFVFSVSDGVTDPVSKTFVVALSGANDAALITGVAAGEVAEAGGVENADAGQPSVTGQLDHTDVDSSNADDLFQAVASAASQQGYGTYTLSASGEWSYTLDNDNAAVQALNVGQSLTDSFTVKAEDGTERVVTVTINGANDAAVVSSADVTLDETNAALSTSGTLTSSDVDNADNTFKSASTVGTIGTFAIDAAGAWTFTANSAFDSLNVGDSVTETFAVTSVDGTESSVKITITGTNDGALISGDAVGSVTEDGGMNNGQPGTPSVVGVLASTDVDNTNAFQAVGSGASGEGYGAYTLSASGEWTYTLDNDNAAVQALNNGESLADSFTVKAEDGTEQVVTITINGANDAAVVSSADVTLVETNEALSTSGTLTSSDVDNADNTFKSASTVGTIGTFAIDAVGAWTFKANSAFDSLNVGDSVTETFAVTSVDGTESSVKITITGTNDGATITAGGTTTGDVIEGTLGVVGTAGIASTVASGDLDLMDVDNGNRFSTAPVQGTYGSIVIDATGAWTYTLNDANPTVDALNVGQSLTDVLTLSSEDGTASQQITITIEGRNDAPRLTGGFVKTSDSTYQFTVTDLDSTGLTYTLDGVRTNLANGQPTTITVANTSDITQRTIVANDPSGEQLVVGNQITGSTQADYMDVPSNDLNSVMFGFGGDDKMRGSSGQDYLFGGQGNDVLWAGSGADVMEGGDGVDTFIVVGSLAGASTTKLAEVNTAVNALMGNPGNPIVLGADYAGDVAAGEKIVLQPGENVHYFGTVDLSQITVEGLGEGGTYNAFSYSYLELTVEQLDQIGKLTLSGNTPHTIVLVDANGAPIADQRAAFEAWLEQPGQQLVFEKTGADTSLTIGASDPDAEMGEDGSTMNGQAISDWLSYGDGTKAFADEAQSGGLPLANPNFAPRWLVDVVDGAVADTADQVLVGTVSGLSGHLDADDREGVTLTYGVADVTPVSPEVIVNGQYGTLTLDTATGEYSYVPNAAAVNGLAADTIVEDSFVFTVTDGANTATQGYKVTITGANEGPVITSAPKGASLTEDAQTIVANGQITSTDADTNAVLSFNGSANGQFGFFQIDSGTGAWTYTLDNTRPATQGLANGQSLTETFTVTVSDDQGATDAQDVVITVTGTNDAPVVHGVVTFENLSVTGSDIVEVPDGYAGFNWSIPGLFNLYVVNGDTVAEKDLDGSITGAGYAVASSDSGAMVAFTPNPIPANAEIVRADGGPFVFEGLQITSAWEDQSVTFIGYLDGQEVGSLTTMVLRGAESSLNFNWGAIDRLSIRGSEPSQLVIDDFRYHSFDGSVVDLDASVVEDGLQIVNGTVVVNDIDGDTLSYSGNATSAYGKFVVDPATGAWTYTLDNAAAQSLAATDVVTETFTVKVDDGQGGSAVQRIMVTISGTNDGPQITSTVHSGAVTEDGMQIARGTVTADDIDVDSLSYSGNATSAYGEFVVDSVTGAWTYTLDNAAAQSLAATDVVTETFTVTVGDGQGGSTTQVVEITISGTNDGPRITSSAQAGAVIEDEVTAAIASGQVTASDTDTGAVLGFTGDADGIYGTFAVDSATGAWTYTLDNTRPATQGLANGQSVTETFAVTVSDDQGASATQNVVVTITGTNDAATINGGDTTGVADEKAFGTPGSNAEGTLTIVDSDNGEGFQAGAFNGQYGTLTLQSGGAWVYRINNNNPVVDSLNGTDALQDSIVVRSFDGTASETITITITASNDRAVIFGNFAGAVVEAGGVANGTAGTPIASDLITAFDVDDFAGFVPEEGLTGTYGTLTLDSFGATGQWTYALANSNPEVDKLAAGQTVTDTFTVNTWEGTERMVTITINGTNDVPVIDVGSGDIASATLTDTSAPDNLTATGTLTVTDIDLSDEVTASVVDANAISTTGPLGTLNKPALLAMLSFTPASVDADTGDANNLTWTFDPAAGAFDYLKNGESLAITYTVTVNDANGGTDTQDITITINGANDAPVVSYVTSTDGTFTIDASDPDDTVLKLAGAATTFFDLPAGTPSSAVIDGVATGDGNQQSTYTVKPQTTATSYRVVVEDVPGAQTVVRNADGDELVISLGTELENVLGPVATNQAGIYYGFGGNDAITGGENNDTIYGGAGNDSITGGSGADLINAGEGANSVTDAGAGADTVIHNASVSTVAIAVTGSDQVTLTASQSGASATSSNGVNTSVDASTSSAGVSLTGGTGNDSLIGGAGNDTIVAGLGIDTIVSGAGGDLITLTTDATAQRDHVVYQVSTVNGVQTAADSPAYGATTGYDVITGVETATDLLVFNGFVPGTGRRLDGTQTSETSANLGAETAITSEASLLVVSNSAVAAGNGLATDIASALDSAFNLSSLKDGEEMLFSVRAADVDGDSNTVQYWVGIFNNTTVDDGNGPGEIQVVALVTQASTSGVIDFDNVRSAIPESVAIGANPNTSTLKYDDTPADDATEPPFTDPVTVNKQHFTISAGDRFMGATYVSDFVPGVTQLPVPPTFLGTGDDRVHNEQFEVYYGSYDAATGIFTVTSTPFSTPSVPTSHTLILYDNDSTSNVEFIEGLVFDGFMEEPGWSIPNGGTANATLKFTPPVDTLYGTPGADTLNGTASAELIQGLAGNDLLSGGDLADTIAGGAGNDTLVGGLGNDTFSYVSGDGLDTFKDFGAGDVYNTDFVTTSGNYTVVSAPAAPLVDLSLDISGASGAGVFQFTADFADTLFNTGSVLDGSQTDALLKAIDPNGIVDVNATNGRFMLVMTDTSTSTSHLYEVVDTSGTDSRVGAGDVGAITYVGIFENLNQNWTTGFIA